MSGLIVLLYPLSFCSCGTKNGAESSESGFFPVVPYLQSQARHVDTSLYSIVKISKAHGATDTAYLRREDFTTAAQDFLLLPDIAVDGSKKYTETKLYDEDLKKVVLTYMPKPGKTVDEITRQDVVIEPGGGGADNVQTIYIETVLNNSDSTVQKKMTWNVTGNFQVLKLINKPNQPEALEITTVTWSGGR